MADEQAPNSGSAQFSDWFERYHPMLLGEVRRMLRKSTTARTGTSVESVAMSVWLSLLEKPIEEIDVSDDDGPWALLHKAAERHCGAWNRYATRHPQVSLGEFELQDPNANSPEMQAMLVELRGFFSDENANALAQAMASSPDSISLASRLTPLEREVFALKLAGSTRPEIAELLSIELHEVDDVWKSVRAKARAIGTRESS